jgi:hypothetical protein
LAGGDAYAERDIYDDDVLDVNEPGSILYRDRYWPQESKPQMRLGMYRDVFLARCGGSRRARSCADQAANQSSFATTGQSANQCAARSTTADETDIAFVVILPGLSDRARIYDVRLAGNFNGSECHAQARRNMQGARVFRVNDASRYVRAGGDDYFPILNDRLRETRGKAVARMLLKGKMQKGCQIDSTASQ